MPNFFSRVVADLKVADSYSRDWYGHATNQAGHAALIGIPLGAALMFFLNPTATVITAFFLYMIVWEMLAQAGKFALGGEALRDSVEDTCHVMAGVGIVVALCGFIPAQDLHEALFHLLVVWASWLIVLAIGVKKRL